jgi:hypothetical protein
VRAVRPVVTALVSLAISAGACTSLNDAPVCDDPAGHCNDPNTNAGPSGPPLHQFRATAALPDGGPPRPPLGVGVDWGAVVVIAVDNYLEGPTGKVGDVWVAERVPGNFPGCAYDMATDESVCGIQLFNPSPIPSGSHMLEGDLAHVSGGTYEEFNCPTCSSHFPNGRTLPEIGTPSIERIGSAATPEPISMSLSQFAGGQDSTVGIVVRINEPLQVLSGPDSHGEYSIDTLGITGTGVTMSPQIGPIVPRGQPTLAAGTIICNLTGVGSYFYNQKILVRGPADLQIVPAGTTSCPR